MLILAQTRGWVSICSSTTANWLLKGKLQLASIHMSPGKHLARNSFILFYFICAASVPQLSYSHTMPPSPSHPHLPMFQSPRLIAALTSKGYSLRPTRWPQGIRSSPPGRLPHRRQFLCNPCLLSLRISKIWVVCRVVVSCHRLPSTISHSSGCSTLPRLRGLWWIQHSQHLYWKQRRLTGRLLGGQWCGCGISTYYNLDFGGACSCISSLEYRMNSSKSRRLKVVNLTFAILSANSFMCLSSMLMAITIFFLCSSHEESLNSRRVS